MTQADRLIKYLKVHSVIDCYAAPSHSDLRITRLSEVIAQIERKGWRIDRVEQKVKLKEGGIAIITEYWWGLMQPLDAGEKTG